MLLDGLHPEIFDRIVNFYVIDTSESPENSIQQVHRTLHLLKMYVLNRQSWLEQPYSTTSQ